VLLEADVRASLQHVLQKQVLQEGAPPMTVMTYNSVVRDEHTDAAFDHYPLVVEFSP
jgi:hypothetical protein